MRREWGTRTHRSQHMFDRGHDLIPVEAIETFLVDESRQQPEDTSWR